MTTPGNQFLDRTQQGVGALTYFECADADVPTTWHGRRVASAAQRFA